MPKNTQHNLKGIQVDNLLGFLAILGLLRSLESTKPNWHPRVYWVGQPLSANLSIAECTTENDIAEICNEGVVQLGKQYAIFENIKDLKFSKDDFRNLAKKSRMNRENAQLVSTLASDGVTKKNKDEVEPTPLCAMFGAGHQHFLERLKIVPSKGTSEDIRLALFSTWDYTDTTFSFRWDPIEHRSYAHQHGNPSETSNKIGTVNGANRLAAIGFGTISSAPKARDIVTPGFSNFNRNTVFSWPLPSAPTSLSGYLALMSHPKLIDEKQCQDLALYGVKGIARVQRFKNDRYFNFTRAQIQFLEYIQQE